ncbi:alpha/beta hydrolase [Paenibacillus sp. D9]|nr:alpha/beta hydrolase [Paenibacillus sp. D9]KKC47725.1 alpha/beta hydrolase [Paenibacillus sp. D9]
MRTKKAALALVMGAALAFPQAIHAAPAPLLHKENAAGQSGNWYTGAVPSQASSDKPVLLFVQGLHSTYERWIGTDSYYDAAYNAGYRTAFVQLPDADGPGGDMWKNGPILASLIRKVAAYYNVPKLNIIAHSKGGIDTQTALVYYGASPYVNVVHQLSTPNRGSELADMAYSNWTSWLGAIMGQQDDAVYSLQTSYMAGFRAQTDVKPEVNATKTYMSGGEGDDGIFTSYWFAHAVLPGEDDGAVSVYSAMGLPYGIQSFTKNISHSAMARASQTWSLVQPKLKLATAALAPSGAAMPSGQPQAAPEAAASGQLQATLGSPSLAANAEGQDADLILRGGPVDGSSAVSFPLESGIGSVALEVMTSREDTSLTLVSPSGQVYPSVAAPADSDPDGIFGKAVRRAFQVMRPEAGEWSLKLDGKNDAFFAMAQIEGSAPAKLKASRKVVRKGEAVQLSVDFGKPIKGSVKRPKLTKSVPGRPASFSSTRQLPDLAVDGSLNMPLTAPAEPGIYNISFDVEGVTDKGERIVRSVNYNFAVADDQGIVK